MAKWGGISEEPAVAAKAFAAARYAKGDDAARRDHWQSGTTYLSTLLSADGTGSFRTLAARLGLDEATAARFDYFPVITAGPRTYRGYPASLPSEFTDPQNVWREGPFMDRPAGLVVRLDGAPIAIGTAWPDLLISQRLLIAQMHPLTEVLPEELRELAWSRLLIAAFESVAVKAGFKYLAVQSTDNNYWANSPGEDDVHMRLAEASSRYDEIAERAGFTRDTADRSGLGPDWVKDLEGVATLLKASSGA